MPLEGHWQRLHANPTQRTSRERRAFAALVTALAALAAAVVVMVAVGGSSSARDGCLDVTIASTTGGARIRACGADARRVCAGDPAAVAPLDAGVRARCRELHLGRPRGSS